MNSTEPVVRIDARLDADSMHLMYEVINSLDVPIFVFDRLYDLKASALSQDWAYTAFDDARVWLCRQIWPLPRGLHHENPEVPYGRYLGPGAKLSGQLVLPLPLVERDPYYAFLHQAGRTVDVKLTQLVLRVGWARVSDLRGGSSVELEGEKLVLFPYDEAILKQKFANSPPANIVLRGTASR